jgi:uncharacterized OsmC-like protein
MTAEKLRALQAPLKQRYKDNPASAVVRMTARGQLDVERVACRIESSRAELVAGLHPAAGGDGTFACAAEMLLESLIGCAGTTLCAVATALAVPVTGGTITATGTMDFRGTLGVDRNAPVGLTEIELAFTLDSTATSEQVEKLLALTERYCVVLRTLQTPPRVTLSRS